MANITSGRDPVEALGEEFLERRRRGEKVSISEYIRRYPQWAERIREFFGTLAMIEDLKEGRARPVGKRPQQTAPPALERMGDFRIIGEVGRGGMAVVYEAEQQSLGRRVALKVIHESALASPKALQRFHREAQAAAGLHHSNIVPVYGVGQEDGKHYYVMQFIEGCSFDRVLEQLRHKAEQVPQENLSLCGTEPDADGRVRSPQHSYWRQVARIGAEVAEALQYAHDHGIWHRDVKPGNLILDRHGTVWITDFGLAKLTQREDLTGPNDVFGTLRYMAPEQLLGKADARSDIYSLGITLYEMLTLRPAYDQKSTHELVARLAQDEPLRPRKVNPRIPRDLETIVLKAIARRPADRYQTAGALAEDLRRFLEDRPPLARRATPWERFGRWCRRNPLVAALSTAVFVLLIAVAVVASAGYLQTRRAAQRAEEALAGQTRQRERAEAVAELALEVLDRIYTQFAPDRVVGASEPALEDEQSETVEVPRQPVLSKETAAVLENMLAFYDRVAEQTGDDPKLRRRVAEANRRLGDIHFRLGNYQQARAAYEKSASLYAGLHSRSPSIQYSEPLARIYNELGRVLWAMQQPGEAQQAHRKALQILEPLADRDDSPAGCRFELARTHYFLAHYLIPSPDRMLARRGPPGPPNGRPPGPFGARGPSPLGRARRTPGQPFAQNPDPLPPWDEEDRPGHLDRAIEILETLCQQQPEAAEYQRLLALCYRDLSIRAFPPNTGSDHLMRAVTLLEELTEKYPEVPDYWYDLSETYAMVDVRPGPLSHETRPAAEARLRQALEISQRLVAEHPNVPDYLASQTHILYKLAELERRAGRVAEAEKDLRAARTAQKRLAEEFPHVARFPWWLARVDRLLAELLQRRGAYAEAGQLMEEAIAALQSLPDDNPFAGLARRIIDEHRRTLADLLEHTGESERAEAIRRSLPSARGPGPPGPRGRGGWLRGRPGPFMHGLPTPGDNSSDSGHNPP